MHYLHLSTLPSLSRYINPFFLYSTLHRLRTQPHSLKWLSLSFFYLSLLRLISFCSSPQRSFLHPKPHRRSSSLRRSCLSSQRGLISSQVHAALLAAVNINQTASACPFSTVRRYRKTPGHNNFQWEYVYKKYHILNGKTFTDLNKFHRISKSHFPNCKLQSLRCW